MIHKIEIHRLYDHNEIMSNSTIYAIFEQAESIAKINIHTIELSFIGNDEMQQLNAEYRNKNKATNILSFPQELDPIQGDIIVAVPTVISECKDHDIPFHQHLTHLLIHGYLHLAGFDHTTDKDAEMMESLEIQILHALHQPNPYQE